MSTVFLLLRWGVLAILLWGGSLTLGRGLRLKPCFSPVVTLCTIALLVYCGGLFGALRPVSLGIIILCIVALPEMVRHHRNTPMAQRELPVIPALFLVASLGFVLVLSRGTLVHYDNFTHWALVVKEMLITHSFPTADSVLIEFTNYPTGTASWIYFVCTVVGHGENSMVMAQGLLIFAALYAIFGIIQERGRFLLVVALGAGLSLLSIFNLSIRINNLLVDFVLPVLSLAAIALIYRHRREPFILCVAIVPILGLLVVVKSTGIIFTAIPLLYLIYTLVQYSLHKFTMKLWCAAATSIALSILPLVGWNLRVGQVFHGVSNKFETDLSLLEARLGGKTAEEISLICRLFLSTITDITQRFTMGILLFHGLAIVACVIGCVWLKKDWSLPRVLIVMDVVLVGYLMGILAMYIFSMPMEEAIYLAAFDRYSSSIVVLFGGVLTMSLIVDMEHSFHYRLGEVEEIRSFRSVQTKNLYIKSCVGCILIIALVLTSEYNGMVYQEKVNSLSLPHTVKDVAGDNWSTQVDDGRYLAIADDTHDQVTSYYLHYVARYYLRANQVDTICLFYEDNFLNLLHQYDYLVIVESTPHTQQLMQKYLGQSGETGIYDLSALLSTV